MILSVLGYVALIMRLLMIDKNIYDFLQQIGEKIKSDPDYEKKRIQWEKNNSAMALRFSSTHIPEKIRHKIISDYFRRSNDFKKLGKAILPILSSGGICVILGAPGTGKTWAALRISAYVCRDPSYRYHSANYVYARKFDTSRCLDFALYEAVSAAILVLDDIGTEARPQHIESLLFQRHMRHGLTLCTTNMTREELLDYYDQRIADRLDTDAIFVNFLERQRGI